MEGFRRSLPTAYHLPPTAYFLPLLLASFCVARPAAAANWTDTRVFTPFVCRADFTLSSIEGSLQGLSQLQNDLVQTLGIAPAREPIELYLFHDKPTYARYLAQYFPKLPYRRALYIKGEGLGKVFAYWSREFEVDLRHECTHALLHASLPMVPLWLDEGLAKYFEVPPERRAFDNPYLSTLQWNLRFGIAPKIEDLEKKGNLAEMGQTEYRAAWAWVHFMLHGPADAHNELVRFLADIQANTPPGLLSRRLARRVPQVQQTFVTHFRHWKRPTV